MHLGGDKYYKVTLPVGSTRRDAERELRRLLVERDNKKLTRQVGNRRLRELWSSFEATGLGRLSPYTRDDYRGAWRRHIQPHLGDKKVSELTVGDVEDWLAALSSTGMAYNTVKNLRICLSAMLTFACRRGEDGLTLPHVAQRAKMPSEEPVSRMGIPDPAAIAAVLRELVATDLELACFERICAVTGCRVGEAAALRFDDLLDDAVKFDEAVRVERLANGLAAEGGETNVTIGATKTRTKRVVSIDDTTAALIEAWAVERRNRYAKQASCDADMPVERERDLLFPAADGISPCQPGKFAERWKRACSERGIRTHQHQLRHLVGTMTAENFGIAVAQERLGHPRIDTTRRYAQVRATMATAAAALMGDLLDTQPTP